GLEPVAGPVRAGRPRRVRARKLALRVRVLAERGRRCAADGLVRLAARLRGDPAPQRRAVRRSRVSEVLDAALVYARRGYRVFPCVPGTKKPYTTNGFKDATRDEGMIEGWWREWPTALIGTPDTCTVDIETKPDGPNGWETWHQLVAEHGEPIAPLVKTGNYP